VRGNLVTYQEALRQATNPDDFALRFQGISSTSDAKWDNFDGKPGEEKAAPGSAQYVAQMNNSAQRAPTPAPQAPQRASTPAPAAQPAKPAAAPKPEDDFQIERF
jgi:twitching motility protein PilT